MIVGFPAKVGDSLIVITIRTAHFSEPFILLLKSDTIKIMNHYQKKQFAIAVIFVFIIVVIGGGLYFLLRPAAPTCFDGIQNQGEKGTDCGGPCGPCEEPEDLIILLEEFIPTVPSDFDLVAKIENPNPNWGIESLNYQFNIYDSNNQLIGYKTGNTYLLPQETKYIIEQRMTTKMDPARVNIELNNINWRKLKDFKELEIRIKNGEIKNIEQGFNKLVGNVENKSNYDLDKIEVSGLLFSDGKIITVGRTEMRTILMGETRYFEINWPYEASEEVKSFELKPYTNIFLNDNFLKIHGTQERFKEY